MKTTYIQDWLLNGSNQSPEALAARRQLYQALVQRKADQRRFDQSLYWASVHGSWLDEPGSLSQLEKAQAEGKHELVARMVDAQRQRRISYCGWKLAMHAAHVNLQLSIGGFTRAIQDVYRTDGYALDTLKPCHVNAFLDQEEEGSQGFDETNRSLAYHMDLYRLPGALERDAKNRDAKAIDEAYHIWRNGTHNDFGSGFCAGASSFTFISWRTCQHDFVGVHLLAPFTDLLRRFTYHGPDRPVERIPSEVEHAYGLVNEPQYEQRLAKLDSGSNLDQKVMEPFLRLHQNRRRAEFIAKVDELQTFVRDLTAFNEQLLAFISLHRRDQEGVERLSHPFEKLAAKYNLLAALSVSSDVTRLIEQLREVMLRKYLPRADRIRPLLTSSFHQSDTLYTAALDGLSAFYKDDDTASSDTATRLGQALIECELESSARRKA